MPGILLDLSGISVELFLRFFKIFCQWFLYEMYSNEVSTKFREDFFPNNSSKASPRISSVISQDLPNENLPLIAFGLRNFSNVPLEFALETSPEIYPRILLYFLFSWIKHSRNYSRIFMLLKSHKDSFRNFTCGRVKNSSMDSFMYWYFSYTLVNLLCIFSRVFLFVVPP